MLHATGMVNRRQFLEGAGTAGIASLAGCIGGGVGGGSGSIKVGLAVPFSGGYGYFGKAEERGAQIAMEQVNASDEILPDTEIEMVTGDTKTDPEVGLSATRDLVQQEGIDHLMGATSTSVANAIRNFVASRDLTFTIVAASSPFLTQDEDCNRKTFRTHNHSGIFAEAGAAWSTEQFGEEVYLVHQDYSYGYTVRDNVTKGVEGAGGEVIGKAAKPLGADQFGGVIDEIIEMDPDWVSMQMTGTGGLPFFQQAASRGLDVTCSGGPPGNAELGKLTNEQFEKLPDIYSDIDYYTLSLDNESNRQFKADYGEKHGGTPVPITELGYAPMRFVVEAIHAAGGGGASTDEIIEAAEGMSFEAPRGTINMRACDHQGAVPNRPNKVVSVDGDVAQTEVVDEIDTEPYRLPCSDVQCAF